MSHACARFGGLWFSSGSRSWPAGGEGRLVLDDPDVIEVSAEEAAGWAPSGRQKRKRKQVRLNGEVYFFFVLFGERSWILLSLSLFPSRSCRLLLEWSVEERKSYARLWCGQRGTAILGRGLCSLNAFW